MVFRDVGFRVLGGSWVVISRVISRVTILITHIRGLITPLITTHEPPSKFCGERSELGFARHGSSEVGRFRIGLNPKP